MKKFLYFFLLFVANGCFAQAVNEKPVASDKPALNDKLTKAMQDLEADASMRHATIGFSVVENKTGNLVYEHNAQTGLAPASTQKILTSCAAFDLLGKRYRYTTDIIYKNFDPAPSRSYFIIRASGDPTFGSSRFDSTKASTILKNIIGRIREIRLAPVSSQYIVLDSAYRNNSIPGGWLWEDIGNYYGASAQGFNWMENQYDIILKSGSRPGDKVKLVTTIPAGLAADLHVEVKSAEKKSGDNSVVYPDYGSFPSIIEGTIPVNEDSFAIGASIADPQSVFIQQLNNKMKTEGISMFYGFDTHPPLLTLPDSLFTFINLYRHVSPPLDSINYWFLKKSINLYGEALLKTMAVEKTGNGSTEDGVEVLKSFWADHDIEKSALHILDGSGLSPQNRVTTDALVNALLYAKTRPWFSSFYYALPEYNGMKMKSGSIGGVKAYAGYHKASDGKEYTYAVIVNNFDGNAADVVKKLYKLLDNLK